MFVDRATVIFSAGKGGNGSASFRREKFIPKGGPDGGDGGNGGKVVLVSRKKVSSLIDFKGNHHIGARNGGNGGGNNKSGKNGEDRIMEVPPGTIHTSQEIESTAEVYVNDTITSHARVISKRSRRNMDIISIDINVTNQDGKTVLTGKTTFMSSPQFSM